MPFPAHLLSFRQVRHEAYIRLQIFFQTKRFLNLLKNVANAGTNLPYLPYQGVRRVRTICFLCQAELW